MGQKQARANKHTIRKFAFNLLESLPPVYSALTQ